MQDKELNELLSGYRNHALDQTELALLKDWVMFGDFEAAPLTDERLAVELNRIERRLPLVGAKRYLWSLLAAAASIVLAIGVFFATRSLNKQPEQAQARKNTIKRYQGATLTLANGKQIELSTAHNGQLAAVTGISIVKDSHNQLVYTITEPLAATAQANTLRTANGQTFKVCLPDGTVAWLNAASKLTYNLSFKHSSRREVSLDGEAYFEVAKNADQPFVVKTAQQEITVLGTHFNVNAYANEPARTTLLEGTVKVGPTGVSALPQILRPGQQAQSQNNGLTISNVNPAAAVAWRDGVFSFAQETLPAILKRVARWYDLDIVNQTGFDPARTYSGNIAGADDVHIVLQSLADISHLKFKLQERRLTISKD